MAREYIITMTAANRSGILSAVTKAMAELGGDLREASQTVVRGFFTMIFSADFPETLDQNIIRDHLLDVCRPFGIDIGLKVPASETPGENGVGRTQTYLLRLGGTNKPGVLRKLSSVIAMRRIDITGMHAVRTADDAGFEMVLKIAVPVECNIEDVLRDLHQVGEEFETTAEIRDLTSESTCRIDFG
ncbi:MAG: hypothetical protein JNL58_20395 [Planctomyces sp.]|nr:hypothetical protein [Planctomyces sp.]